MIVVDMIIGPTRVRSRRITVGIVCYVAYPQPLLVFTIVSNPDRFAIVIVGLCMDHPLLSFPGAGPPVVEIS
jgi:hypothetical protein